MSTQYQWEEPQPETRRHHKRRRQANAAPADRFDEDNQEGENDDTTLPNTYQSIHGDCTDSEALSVTRKARRLGYHHSSDSDSNSSDEDEGDTLQASNASSQHKDANGQFSMQELLSGKFDEAVRKIGRDQERRTSNVSRCWGCRHGISGGSNIADETLSKFNEWIRKHFGTMDEQEFAIQCARYHTLKVRRLQVKAGGHCDKWRADSILYTSTSHVRPSNHHSAALADFAQNAARVAVANDTQNFGRKRRGNSGGQFESNGAVLAHLGSRMFAAKMSTCCQQQWRKAGRVW